jgi:tetratricopeptide (TPR) repeat protein
MSNSRQHKRNPYDYISPVADKKLFAGRKDELAKINEELGRLKGHPPTPAVIALSGERRVGKTSILCRIEELCSEENILTTRIALTESTVSDPWNFWQVLFESILDSLRTQSIFLPTERHSPIGFVETQSAAACGEPLRFPSHYAKDRLCGAPLTSAVVINDIKLIAKQIIEKGFAGIVLLLDEAHLLVDINEIQQQLRDAIAQVTRIGIVFAGEPKIGRMFTDHTNRFFHQGTIIQVLNFQNIDDVAKCAISPLIEEEKLLISPMTIDYLTRLSQGKPNQIRLICNSIYSSYINGRQNDLNINISTLNDVLDIIAGTYTEHDLKTLIERIQTLNSVDLEILYRITRYPDWDIEQIIDLEESFRGETRSSLAEERRRRLLSKKRNKFIVDGLLQDKAGRCVLSGDEYTYLYVRFLYEIRKYGDLTRRLELDKGPPTPFSEKVEKLVRSLSFELGRYPTIRYFTHYAFNIESTAIRSRVRQRFGVLQNFVNGQKLNEQGIDDNEIVSILADCSRVCELVKESGPHHLVSMLVRNQQDVNSLIHVELYFDPAPVITLVTAELERLLKKQSEDAKIWLEDVDDLKITYLPNLCDLLEIVGLPKLGDILQHADEVVQWRVKSVQHIIKGEDEQQTAAREKTEDSESKDEEDWINRYDSADETGAIAILDSRISQVTKITDNPKLARYYNDRGYIKSVAKIGMLEDAKRDLERAIAYHYINLELPLLNLAVIYIDEKNYPAAIPLLEDALFLATSRENIIAGYLKLRLATWTYTPRGRMEQHPANVVEAAYINLAYVLLETDHPGQALEALEEGLALFPSSYRLKHAKARILVSKNQASKADEIYEDLRKADIDDEIIKKEVVEYVNRFLRRKPKRKRRTNT